MTHTTFRGSRTTQPALARAQRSFSKSVLFCGFLVLGLFLTEVFLHLLLPLEGHYVWWPNKTKVFHADAAAELGLEGTSRFEVNSIGLRGDDPDRHHTYRILTVGGSTTECRYLDQEEAWPQLLQERLNRAQHVEDVWVANAGSSGLYSRHHVVLMETVLPHIRDLDLVVLLVGAGDLLTRLKLDRAYDPGAMNQPAVRNQLRRDTFAIWPLKSGERMPFLKRTATWIALNRIRDAAWPTTEVLDGETALYRKWRGHRRSASTIRRELPDLSQGLEEYRRNLNSIIDRCREASVCVLLVTHPCAWGPDLSSTEEDLLWLGGVGNFLAEPGCEYYAAESLRRGLEAYNEAVREVARKRQVGMLDLAADFPAGMAPNFYDDVHFAEAGAERVAERLSEFLIEQDFPQTRAHAHRPRIAGLLDGLGTQGTDASAE